MEKGYALPQDFIENTDWANISSTGKGYDCPLQVGDLIYLDNQKGSIDHVVIFAGFDLNTGEPMIIDNSQTIQNENGYGVSIRPLDNLLGNGDFKVCNVGRFPQVVEDCITISPSIGPDMLAANQNMINMNEASVGYETAPSEVAFLSDAEIPSSAPQIAGGSVGGRSTDRVV